MRGIFQRPAGSDIWWISYFAGGKHHREKLGPKKVAIEAYRLRKTQIRTSKFFPDMVRPCPVTFDHLATDVLAYSDAHKRPRSAQGDRWMMRRLLQWFGSRPAAQLSSQEIESRLAEFAASRAPATVNRYRSLLSLTFSLAIRNGRVTVNPVRQLRRRKENNARVRFLSAVEEKALRRAVRRLYPLREPEFDLALHTGLRRGELHLLDWTNVSLERAMLTIPRSKHGEKRYVPINSAARRALVKLAHLRGPATPLVSAGASGLVCAPRHARWFNRCIAAAEVPNFRYHDLRHTFASRLVMADVNLRTVQELCGHKTLSTTLRYAHLSAQHQQSAVERLCQSNGQAVKAHHN